MKLLKKLYLTHSPSKKEKDLSDLVVNELKKIGIKNFKVDKDYQIYRLIENTPLICAHMDQVTFPDGATSVFFSDGVVAGNGNLGADDKNGVWILLQILKKRKKDISFIFSTQEEMGCAINSILIKNEEVLKTIKYGLVFDRKGESDVIGKLNQYCTKEFEDALEELMKKHGYESVRGSFSDCNKLKNHFSCINISCGYYNPHTTKEFTIIQELFKSLRFGEDILNTLDKRYDPPPAYSYSYKPNNNWREEQKWMRDTGNYLQQNSGKEFGDGMYQCNVCYECFDWEELDGIRRCPDCWGMLTKLEFEKEEEPIEKDGFIIGEEVMILGKSEGIPITHSASKWSMFDTGYIFNNEKGYYRLSKEKNGKMVDGIFTRKDLVRVRRKEDDYFNDPVCCMCEKSTMDITCDQNNFGYIYMCPLCSFQFITEKKYNSINDLRDDYIKFVQGEDI